jgi:hypothetical protein
MTEDIPVPVHDGVVEKVRQTDSLIAGDTQSAGAGHAGTQGAGSTGTAHYWLTTTADIALASQIFEVHALHEPNNERGHHLIYHATI